MVEFLTGLWLYSTVGLFILLVYLLYLRIPKMKSNEITLLAIFLIAGLILFMYEQINLYIILGLMLGILTFNGLLNSMSPLWRMYYVSLSVLYLTLLHWIGLIFLAQALLMGLLSSITNIKEHKNSIESRRVEIERDVVHIIAGILFMAIFYFEAVPVAVSILMIVILGGILAISFGELYKGHILPSFMYRFERNGATLGHGALWLALGALLAVSFLSTHDVLIVFAAIFIGDPVATIVGIYKGKKKLPYNARKSAAGTIAYFISTSAICLVLAGVYGILIGAVAALVESLKLAVDDNFTVSLALVVLILILGI